MHLVLTHPVCVFFLKGSGSGEACGFKHPKPLPHPHKESFGGVVVKCWLCLSVPPAQKIAPSCLGMNHNIGPTGKHMPTLWACCGPWLSSSCVISGLWLLFLRGVGGACELKSMTLTSVLVSLQHEEPPGGTLDPGDGHPVGAHLGGVVRLGGAGRDQDPRRGCGGGPADQCLHPAAAGAGAEAVPAEQVPGPDGGGGEKQPAGGTCQQRCHFLSALESVCLWDSSLLMSLCVSGIPLCS